MELPILDRDRLELITRGNRELANAFLSALFEEADELILQLGTFAGSDNCIGISDIAHTLKGLAAELGATQLQDAAAALEAQLQPARWPEDVERIRAALEGLRSYVNR